MKKEIKIGDRLIGPGHSPFVIAEMSGNHNQSLDRAFAIIDAAAEAGAHALKIQTYTPDTMTLNMKEGAFFINDAKSLWNGQSLYDLYQLAYTPWEWHKPIFDRCKQHNILGFSTPFDYTAVDFLEELDVPCYKIASFENGDLPLIKRVAQTKKPVIISTGMATVSELYEAVTTLRENGCSDIILLKCTSTYPATPKDTNILTIPHMRELFDTQVGLSDHTLGVGVAVASIALGATVVEKHFTLARADGGVDSAFSMEPHEMRQLVVESERAWLSLGKVAYGPGENEKKSLQFRRSIFVTEDLNPGDVLTTENLKCLRPGAGLSPKHYETLLGKKVNKKISKGTPASWEIFS